MAITNKYEQLSEEAPNRFHGRHARLGRAVEVHRVSCIPDSPKAQRARQVGSKLSRLDHPLIPYLIDFLEDENGCHLVVEQIESTTSVESDLALADDDSNVLDRLSLFEQVADALCHAAERDIAHGALDISCVHGTGIGVTKITGLGLRQLNGRTNDATESDGEFGRFKEDDLQKLKQLVSECLQEFSARSDEEANEQQAIQKLQNRVAERDDDICRFSKDLRTWLHRELAIREAKKLAFADREKPQTESEPDSKLRVPIIVGATIVCLLLSGFLGFMLWPKGTREQVASKNDKPEVESDEGEVKPPPPVTSTLQDVGTLNASERPSAETAEVADPVSPGPEKMPAATPSVENGAAPPMEEEPEPEPEATPEVAAEPETETNAEPAGPPPRTKDPFEQARSTIDLPTNTSSEVVQLFETDLEEDEPLILALLSNPPDAKTPEFSIEANEAKQVWKILHRRKSESTIVAEFARRDTQLKFRWTEAASELPTSNDLRNTMLQCTHGKWSHHVAMRAPVSLPVASFDLERNRPYNLKIANAPNEMFLEFVPSDDTLAVASPLTIPWKDAVMTIGLDAGKESLIVLQIKPQPRGKLRTVGLARQTSEARRQPIKKGFGRSLPIAMRELNKNLFGMKEGVKQIKGKNAAERKKVVQATIKRMEEQKKISEAFIEAYMAAVATKLHLRIYSEVSGHKIVLVDYSDSTVAE